MLLTFSSTKIIFYTVTFFVILQSSYQYIYPCNSSVPCGCSSNPASVSRIVGGEPAGTNTWDWTVSIFVTVGSGAALCGGAILSSSWIITAAHCFSSVNASQVTVYSGSNRLFAGQIRTVASIVVHPSYISNTKVNDIALIKLNTPLAMTNGVKTICIPSVNSSTLTADEWPSADLSVVAVGWGTLVENGSISSTLQQVTLQTIAYNTATCSSVLNNRQWQLCAGVSGGGKDTCQGDSGGPLMMYTTSQQWMLVGVTSYGKGCARLNYAGVYTRVAAYQSWIAMTTNNSYVNPISSESANRNPSTATTSSMTTNQPITSSTRNEMSPVSHELFLVLFSIFTSFYSLSLKF